MVVDIIVAGVPQLHHAWHLHKDPMVRIDSLHLDLVAVTLLPAQITLK